MDLVPLHVPFAVAGLEGSLRIASEHEIDVGKLNAVAQHVNFLEGRAAGDDRPAIPHVLLDRVELGQIARSQLTCVQEQALDLAQPAGEGDHGGGRGRRAVGAAAA